MDREIAPAEIKRRRLRRAVAALLVAGAAAGLAAVALGWLRPSIARARVRIVEVDRGPLEATLLASGRVVAAAERVLSSPAEARIVRVLKRPGDVLREGEEILALDTSSVALDLKRLEDRLAQVENDREQARLSVGESLADLESRIETGRLDLEIAQYRLEQSRRLDVDGLVSEEVLKLAEVEVQKATIRLRRLDEEVVAARRAHDTRLARLALDAGTLREERDETRRLLDLATTRSPTAGVLTWVAAEEGALMARGAVLARIADLATFRVEATVSDAYASRLALAQPVRVLVGDATLTGRVASVLPAVESGAVGFTAELDDPAFAALRHNLRVDVLVVTERQADTLRLPRGPFAQGGGDRHQVFVVRGDHAERADVLLGLVGHDAFEVLEGLNEGDRIIVSDMRDFAHARQVRLR